MAHLFVEPETDVQVWGLQVAMLGESLRAAFARIISDTERERAARIRLDSDRITFVAAHALKRLQLSYLTGIAPQQLALRYGPTGKPYVDAGIHEDLHFSISHTNGFVAAAAAIGYEIGIDVEACNRRADTMKIARRHFLAREIVELRKLRGRARREHFFALWTLKEALLKATGSGLRTPMSAVDARVSPPHVKSRYAKIGLGWQAKTFRPTPHHVVAMVLRPSMKTT